MKLPGLFVKIGDLLRRNDEHRLRDMLLYGECSFHYFLWCLRYPRLFAHRFFIARNSRLLIGRKASFQLGHDIYFMSNFNGDFYRKVTMGNKIIFQANCRLSIHEELVIGDYTGFAEGVSIHDETHPITGGDDPHNARPLVTAPVIIGRNVWVGTKATILHGVTIGDNAVIGAHSLVTKDIPANAVAVGTPARVIRIVPAPQPEAEFADAFTR